jgi:hypothetical protein
MRLPFAASFRALTRPGTAFAPPPPTLGRAVRDMALVWMPLALANTAWTVWRAIRAYESLRSGTRMAGLLEQFGVDPAIFHDLITRLPAPPAFGRLWPWLLLTVPLGVLGTWLHHAIWDHMGLWLLRGLKERQGFRTSLVAEAEALRIAAVGTLLGFLGYLPVLGVLLALPLLLLDAYLWLFRGFALAARHRCELWRGIAATVLHAVLLGCFVLALFTLMLFMVRTVA